MPIAESNSTLKGQCACGALRYELTQPPMFTHCCHCTQCQKLTGSAFALNTIIENDCIEILSGTVAVTPGPSESGRPHDIYRCPSCQTAVWSDYGGRPNYRFVRVGTLDDPSAIEPDVHIFTRSKLDWVVIPDAQKAFEIFYEVEEEWPPSMLKRREAALNPAGM
ncbi:GFA family protein [Hwanghaeella grinnelliae]|uniref:GFA family protein n=2 Tax=Hwanghaeella grinnelliae TaxID=2500179 RepID=A0A3S2VSV6_9PROT|nr:GFA family protein [Hwanghaeella grinnelliae]